MSVATEVNESNATRGYYEIFAGPAVTSARMLIVVIALAITTITLAGLLAYTVWGVSHQKIVILQKAPDGALDRAQYVDMGKYVPGEREIEHFGYTYVVATYSRVRSTLAADFFNHLAFLPRVKRRQEMYLEQQNKWIEAFRKSYDPEVRVNVNKVRMVSGTQNTMVVDFEKHFFVNGREDSAKQENWSVELIYTLAPEAEISGDLVPVNPLGITIVEARETKAY
jgi:type IV secretory pathway component VirB8